MKTTTKQKIAKWGGRVIGIGVGIGLTAVVLTAVATGPGALIITTGLKGIGALVGGGMKTGLVVVGIGNGVTAIGGNEAGDFIASKIKTKKK